MEDEKVQKMARMLEKGGKMLAAHCECGAPLFKYREEILCAACGKQYEKKGEEYILKEAVLERKTGEAPAAPKAAEDMRGIERTIIEKLNIIAVDLKSETDLHRIHQQLECIETGVKILKDLKK